MASGHSADFEGSGSGPNLTASGETPYETPPTSVSRRSSYLGTLHASSSTPPLPDPRRLSGEMSNDEGISILDPRRFTPTLHANLVSEILSLRRELEAKNKYIEDFESQLESSRTENDTLSRRLAQSNKDNREVKRQIQQLEHGTLVALEELAKDRDDKKRETGDLKDKVDRLEKKIKAQDEDASRTQKIHDRDRDAWETQKRTLERRAHVSETRLKTFITELEAQHAAEQDSRRAQHSEDEETRDSGLGNDSDTNSVHSTGAKQTPSRVARHARNISSASQRSLHRGYRASTQSDAGKATGLSLADELDFDGEDEDALDEIDEDDEEGEGEQYTEHAITSGRSFSPRSSSESDNKAKRVLGLAQDGRPLPTVNEGSSLHMLELGTIPRLDGESLFGQPAEVSEPGAPQAPATREVPVAPRVLLESAIEDSPRHSPEPRGIVESRTSFYDDMTTTTGGSVHSRTESMSSPFDAEAIKLIQEKPAIVVVSAGAQTVEEPIMTPASPPAPESLENVIHPQETPKQLKTVTGAQAPIPAIETSEMSTQTDPMESINKLQSPAPGIERENRPAPLPIPSISIHPASAPPSPRETILTPGTKSVGTQTQRENLAAVRSTSMQTDEIRVDRRMMKLPPHLLPSAIRSKPSSPAPSIRDDADSEDTADGPTATPKQLSEKALGKSPLSRPTKSMGSSPPSMPLSHVGIENRYPGNNDNGPLQPGKESSLRRPFRSGSLFAGFDSDTNEDRQTDADEEIPDIRSAPVPYSTPSFPKRSLRDRQRKPPTPVPEDKEVTSRTSTESTRQRTQANGRVAARNSLENARVAKRQPSIRRAALIKGGTNAHSQQRSRSPSLQSGASSSRRSSTTTGPTQPPPFPIPNRLSSRRLFQTSKSDGAQSPTPRGTTFYQARRSGKAPQVLRNENVRKVKSAAAMPSNGVDRSTSRSPPAPLRDSGPPPLPHDAITRSQFAYAAHRMSSSQLQTPATVEPEEAGQPTVVDAIAATMVGEWMWKYVRRRKSFNVPDSPEDLSRTAADGSVNVTGNGVRHKRWVWISPYERTVMWSTKQPASGTALLGKNGRKLIIQSVLDVKDDTPLPKNSSIQTSFNRSILILTPARALKFTAVSQERHYLWLTALSFLAHSNMGTHELAAIPPPPSAEPNSAPSTSSAFPRRGPIRDSVKLTKDKRPTALSSMTSRSSSSRKGALLSPTIHTEEPIPEAADAPTIPRYTAHVHGRKRSNTGPRIPPAPATLRNFSSPTVPHRANYTTSATANTAAGSHDTGLPLSQPASLFGNASSGHSPHPSTATDTSSRVQYIDPIGTVRMEAFVAPRRGNDVRGGEGAGAAHSSVAPGRMRTGVGVVGRPRGHTQWSTNSGDPRRSGLIMMDDFDAFDPFRGF